MSIEPGRQSANRKNLADALRELRRAAGLSGERLAARCAMSQAKVSRLETGKTLPTVSDVERILQALEVPAPVAADLLALARVANVDYTSWRAYARVGLWHAQEELRALAESARIVRQFLPAIPTGLLQIPDYARQVLTPTVTGRPARDVDRVLQSRLESQVVLDDQTRRFVFLLTEQAVRWRRAAADIMAKQLTHMAEMAAKPNVEIAIIPQSVDIYASPLNIFLVYDERLVTVETFSGSVALRDPQEISYHLNLFEFFLGHALRGVDAVAFLRLVAQDFMRDRD